MELITDFGTGYKPDEQSRYFDPLIWEQILLFKNDIINIYELKRDHQIFKIYKKNAKKNIEIIKLNNYYQILRNEKEKLKDKIETWDIDYLFQIKNNDLLFEIVKIYNFDFTINNYYTKAYRDPEVIDALVDLIKHMDSNCKIVSFAPEAQGVFVLFPSQLSLTEFLNSVEGLKKKIDIT